MEDKMQQGGDTQSKCRDRGLLTLDFLFFLVFFVFFCGS